MALIVAGMVFGLGWIYRVPDRPIDGLVIAVLVMTCGALLIGAPQHFITLLIPVIMFNREVRRIIDWSTQDYAEVPITSLAPALVMLMMGMAAISDWSALPNWTRTAAKCYLGAICYAVLIGIFKYKLGCIYTAVNWIAPFMVFLHVVWLKPNQQLLRKWLSVWVFFTTLAAIYGWVQWSVLPPWSKFWMVNAEMASMGNPIAMKCRFFGSFGAPGALAFCCAFASLFLTFGFNKFRISSLPLIVFFCISILMTQSRSSLIAFLITTFFSILFERGTKATRSLVFVSAVVLSVVLLLPVVPGGQMASSRVQTLLNVQDDGSFNGRVQFTAVAAASMLVTPQGFGMGAAGLGSRVDGAYSNKAFDNGYLAVGFTLGVPGVILLVSALYHVLNNSLFASGWYGVDSRLVSLIKGVFAGHLFLMLPANWLDNDTAFVIWTLIGFLSVWGFDNARGQDEHDTGLSEHLLSLNL